MFRQGDWVTIKYGEYQGSYGKVSGIHRDGSAMVIPYSKDGEPGSMISLDGSGLELIEPLMVNREELITVQGMVLADPEYFLSGPGH